MLAIAPGPRLQRVAFCAALVSCQDAHVGTDSAGEAEAPPSLDLAGYGDAYELAARVELNDNGAWSWFSDERALVWRGLLIVGSVRSAGPYNMTLGQPGWGDVELAIYDLARGDLARVVLHAQLQQDDHNDPALLPLADDRLLAVYQRHSSDREIFRRVSAPGDPRTWDPALVYTAPGELELLGALEDPERERGRVTYANLHRGPGGRIYSFYRGFNLDPNVIYSDDEGASWTYGGRLLAGYDGYSEYLVYTSDDDGVVHFVVTEDHPRDYDNNLFHGFLRDGTIHGSDGAPLASLGDEPPLRPWELTHVYAGDADHVPWMNDLELDAAGRPVVVFSVQRDGRDLPPGEGGLDLRYERARWTGTSWEREELAYAGTRLYAGEDDYAGLAALVPGDPDTVFISTNANPVTGAPLISSADGARHHELFRGRRDAAGARWTWEPVTLNSPVDNLRPVVPRWRDDRTALVWMRGAYIHNHGEWTTSVSAMILDP